MMLISYVGVFSRGNSLLPNSLLCISRLEPWFHDLCFFSGFFLLQCRLGRFLLFHFLMSFSLERLSFFSESFLSLAAKIVVFSPGYVSGVGLNVRDPFHCSVPHPPLRWADSFRNIPQINFLPVVLGQRFRAPLYT